VLDVARPVTPEGKVRLEPVKIQAREDGMVKAASAMRPAVVIVLGGKHDLSGTVRRLAPGSEHIRVRMEGVSRTKVAELSGARRTPASTVGGSSCSFTDCFPICRTVS
jgi:hypothetical protein